MILLDSTVVEGHHYSYTVQSLGIREDETSSLSLPAGAWLLPDIPLAPNNILTFNTKAGVLLQWDLPMGREWEHIKIYRAIEGQSPALLKTLPKGSTTFTDSEVQKGQNYFYWIATVNQRGVEGKMKEPVGVRTE